MYMQIHHGNIVQRLFHSLDKEISVGGEPSAWVSTMLNLFCFFAPHISLLQEFMFLDSSGSSACDFIFLVCFVEVEDNKKRHLDV